VEIDASTGGVTKPVVRAKTKAQIVKKMTAIAKERTADRKLHATIAHADARDQAEQLRKMLLSQIQCDEFHTIEVPPVAAVQNGEGLIEFGFCG
jgi:fatty acid-binding protein DegV